MRVLYVSLKPKLISLIKKGELKEIQLVINQLWTKRLIEDGDFVNYEIVVISQSHSSENKKVAYQVKSIYADERMTRYEPKHMEQHFIVELGDKYIGGVESYEKVCSTCHRLLPASEFFFNTNTSDNCSCSCKECYAVETSVGSDNVVEDLQGEIWKDVVGYECLYRVSNFGRVKSVARMIMRSNGTPQRVYEKLMPIQIDSHTGYNRITLAKDGCSKRIGVHRMVAQAFIPNPDKLPVVNHIDWDRTNNHVENLEWCTQKQNVERMNWDKWNHSMNVRPIQQMSLDGKVIAIYPNMKEASKATGIPHSTISAACNGKYGNKQFIWKRL